jgi:hypothetical protein
MGSTQGLRARLPQTLMCILAQALFLRVHLNVGSVYTHHFVSFALWQLRGMSCFHALPPMHTQSHCAGCRSGARGECVHGRLGWLQAASLQSARSCEPAPGCAPPALAQDALHTAHRKSALHAHVMHSATCMC